MKLSSILFISLGDAKKERVIIFNYLFINCHYNFIKVLKYGEIYENSKKIVGCDPADLGEYEDVTQETCSKYKDHGRAFCDFSKIRFCDNPLAKFSEYIH